MVCRLITFVLKISKGQFDLRADAPNRPRQKHKKNPVPKDWILVHLIMIAAYPFGLLVITFYHIHSIGRHKWAFGSDPRLYAVTAYAVHCLCGNGYPQRSPIIHIRKISISFLAMSLSWATCTLTSSYSYITATSRQTALVVFLEDCLGYQT